MSSKGGSMIVQGEQAPDFELADQDGRPVRLSYHDDVVLAALGELKTKP